MSIPVGFLVIFPPGNQGNLSGKLSGKFHFYREALHWEVNRFVNFFSTDTQLRLKDFLKRMPQQLEEQ